MRKERQYCPSEAHENVTVVEVEYGGGERKGTNEQRAQTLGARETACGGGTHIFQPDTILPAQFFSTLRQRTASQGERRLVAAVLEDTVACFQKYLGAEDRRNRKLYADAEAWLFSDDDSWPFAFVNVCEALDIQPPFLRRGLLLWRSGQRAQYQRATRRVESASLVSPWLSLNERGHPHLLKQASGA